VLVELSMYKECAMHAETWVLGDPAQNTACKRLRFTGMFMAKPGRRARRE